MAENTLTLKKLDDKTDFICKHVDVYSFKTKPCKIKEPHLPKRCPFYHDARKDRRRPQVTSYSADMCVYALNEKECPYGDSCPNAHNRVEEFYHPTKYKTKFCTTYPNSIASCEYGEYCCFAHSESDIKIDLIHKFTRDIDFYIFHYKTVWCPFNETNHARDQCVYAHNWQDYRRRPHVYPYEKGQCPNWDLQKIINVYFDGCANGLSCRFSHGWKEQEFHPLAYKTNHCRHGETCSKLHCPFFHSEKDRRNPITSVFVYTPRNRIFTFSRKPDQQQNQTIMGTEIYNTVAYMQPTKPLMFVGSPMEGLRYSPVGSPMGPSSLNLDMPPISHSPPLGSPSNFNPYAPQFKQHSYPDPTEFTKGPPPGLEIVDSIARRAQKPQNDSISLVTESFTKEPIQIPIIQPSPISKHEFVTAKIMMRKPEPEIPSPKDYLSDLPVITKDNLQFLSSGADEENLGKDPKKLIKVERMKEEKQGKIEEKDPLKRFLKENELEQLYEKFSAFGINESDVMTLNDVSLEQLGITGEDKRKLLNAIENSKKDEDI